MSEHDLAHLLSSRICHDLVSPVGAIVNGVDLMRELGSAAGEEMDLIGQSADRASALLELSRLAFGRAAADGIEVPRAGLRKKIETAMAGRRVTLSWSGLDGPGLRPGAARLLAVMALCGRSALGMGGHLRILLAPKASLPLGLTAEGDGADLSPEQMAWIKEGTLANPLPEPRNVEFVLLKGVAAASGAAISVASEPGKVSLAARSL
ncbi:MAG: histidine phosphotransferase family protein [Pseudomonadota bacterium]